MIKKSDSKRLFLLSYFDEESEYQVKEVNGFILVKNINGSTKKPYVSVYTPEKYSNYKNYQKERLF